MTACTSWHLLPFHPSSWFSMRHAAEVGCDFSLLESKKDCWRKTKSKACSLSWLQCVFCTGQDATAYLGPHAWDLQEEPDKEPQ
eukprot:573959-Amphidinium_carterae.1